MIEGGRSRGTEEPMEIWKVAHFGKSNQGGKRKHWPISDHLSLLPMALDWQGEQASQLEDIRRETLDIYNRLHSINQDAAFVQRVHDAFPDLPLLRR